MINQFYSVPVRASDRGRITESELVQQILKIMEEPADAKTLPVGILTTARRPIWAKAREELLKSTTRQTFFISPIYLLLAIVMVIILQNDCR